MQEINPSVKKIKGTKEADSTLASSLPLKLLFFSGGSALTPLCNPLKKITDRSIHLMSPFDSGGSSGKLRRAFSIPAFGDLRNRIIALLDESVPEYDALVTLLNYRNPSNESSGHCLKELEFFVLGNHELLKKLPLLSSRYIANSLIYFRDRFAKEFDFCGASLGNIIIAAAYFRNNKNINLVLKELNLIFPIRGTVGLSSVEDFQLYARLEDW